MAVVVVVLLLMMVVVVVTVRYNVEVWRRGYIPGRSYPNRIGGPKLYIRGLGLGNELRIPVA
jgi:hypothetical protein